MKMSKEEAEKIQSDMWVFATDDTSNCPMFISGGSEGRTKEESAEAWIYAVNLIYRCLYCGLWTATGASPYMPSFYEEHGLGGDYDFCKKLSCLSPFIEEIGSENVEYWQVALICNTDLGQSFVEGFGVENLEDEIYPPFIEALEDIFRKHGVPWEAGDLFDMKNRIA